MRNGGVAVEMRFVAMFSQMWKDHATHHLRQEVEVFLYTSFPVHDGRGSVAILACFLSLPYKDSFVSAIPPSRKLSHMHVGIQNELSVCSLPVVVPGILHVGGYLAWREKSLGHSS